MSITGVAAVELRNLRITGGNQGSGFSRHQGNGVYHNSPGQTLTLTDCTLSQNQAYLFGGGLYNEAGTVVATGTTVSENTAIGGGGIYNTGSITLNDATVRGNTATGVGLNPGQGGDVYNAGPLTLNSTQVTLNTAQTGAGIANYGTVTIGPGSSVTNNSSGNCVNRGGGTGCPSAWPRHAGHLLARLTGWSAGRPSGKRAPPPVTRRGQCSVRFQAVRSRGAQRQSKAKLRADDGGHRLGNEPMNVAGSLPGLCCG